MAETRSVARARLLASVLVFGGFWPVVTLINATLAIHYLPYYSPSWLASAAGAAGGLVMSAGELAATGFAASSVSLLFFLLAERRQWLRKRASKKAIAHLSEPGVMLVAGFWGVSLWYPAVLNQPILGFLLLLPTGLLSTMVAGLVVVFAGRMAQQGKTSRLAASLLIVGALSPLPAVLRPLRRPPAVAPDTVLLGLDSISYEDTREWFLEWARRASGTNYERAVTPALLTNAVLASILTGQYPSEHGVVQTFQPLSPHRALLLATARQAGYRTVSRFSDQLTASVGTDAGFDDDLSGPVGWRQLVLPIVHNSSVLVPIVRPLLPRAEWLASPPNLAGSFSFSLRRELDELLGAGHQSQKTFVAGHLTYMHVPSYPRYVDLPARTVWQILKSPAFRIKDRSFDWTDSDAATDPVPVHAWKRERLLREVARAVDRSGIVRTGSRMILFSDHGERLGLAERTVVDPRYYHVLLVTFNLPPQSPTVPRSLVDIGHLLGLGQPHTATPRVEFSVFPSELWGALVQTARLAWSGHVRLDAETVARATVRPIVFEPWAPSTSPAPDSPSGPR